jgi:hypothetical protein
VVFFWNRLELLLLSCSCTTHRRSFFYSRILCGLCASRLIRVFSGISLKRPLKKSTYESSMPEVTPWSRVKTRANKQVSERELCHSPSRDTLTRRKGIVEEILLVGRV